MAGMDSIAIVNATAGVFYAVNILPGAIHERKYVFAIGATVLLFCTFLYFSFPTEDVSQSLIDSLSFTVFDFVVGVAVWYFFHRVGRKL